MSSRLKDLLLAFRYLRSQIESGTLSSDRIKEVSAFCEDFTKFREELTEECSSDLTTSEIAYKEIYEILREAKDFAYRAFEKIHTLTAENSTLKKEVEELQRLVEVFNGHVKKLEVKVENLRQPYITGFREEDFIIGQVISDINKYATQIVLDPLIRGRKDRIEDIGEMQRAIKGQHPDCQDIFTDEIRRKANLAWEGLKLKINWDPDLYLYMGYLKRERNRRGHPKRKKEEVIAAIERIIPEDDQKDCHKILNMREKLEALI